MKKIIVPSLAALAAGLVFSTFSIAAENDTNIEATNWNRVDKAYAASLRHANDEVVESALLHTVKISLFRNDAELPKLYNEVKRLTKNGRTERIRYKAFLVLNVINNPEWVSSTGMVDTLEKLTDENRREFFESLATVMNTSLLGE